MASGEGVERKKVELGEVMEDYALTPVPDRYRNSKLAYMSMASIPMCMYYLAVGSLAAAYAGLVGALIANTIAFISFILLMWPLFSASYKTGLSFDMITRMYGWGRHGQLILSILGVFVMLGFWAMETHWMAVAFQETLRWGLWSWYLILLPIFILVPIFGHKAIGLFNYGAIPLGLGATVYVIVWFYTAGGISLNEAISFAMEPKIPGGLGAAISWVLAAHLAWCLTAGNHGRFLQTKRAYLAAAPFWGAMCHYIFPLMGILLVYPFMVSLSKVVGPEQAAQMAYLPSVPFVAVLGLLGAIIVLCYQLNIQYINAYLPSINLAYVADAIAKFRPGRYWWVIAINIIGIILLATGFWEWLLAWADLAAGLATSAAIISIVNYIYRVSKNYPLTVPDEKIPSVNGYGVISWIISNAVAIPLYHLHIIPTSVVLNWPLAAIIYLALIKASGEKAL